LKEAGQDITMLERDLMNPRKNKDRDYPPEKDWNLANNFDDLPSYYINMIDKKRDSIKNHQGYNITGTKIISISITDGLLQEFDKIQGNFQLFLNKSDMIRQSCFLFLFKAGLLEKLVNETKS
jgi:hypothetical protein